MWKYCIQYPTQDLNSQPLDYFQSPPSTTRPGRSYFILWLVAANYIALFYVKLIPLLVTVLWNLFSPFRFRPQEDRLLTRVTSTSFVLSKSAFFLFFQQTIRFFYAWYFYQNKWASFKHKFYIKNCRLQQDSNSNR